MENALDSRPASEAEFVGEMMGQVDTTKSVAADYELG